MTDDREFQRAITDWLETGSDRTPPHAIDAVLLAVRSTRQDRPLPVPWSTPQMPPIARYLIAAAAIVAISFVALNVAGLPRYVAGPAATPSLSPTPTPTPVPAALTTGDPTATLSPGTRYATVDPFPVHLTFEAPAAFVGNIGGPYAVWLGAPNTSSSLGFELSPQPFKDPCKTEQGTITPVPTTTAEIIAALVNQPGVALTTPRMTTIGGRQATMVTISGPANTSDCTDQGFSFWRLPLGATEEVGGGMTADLFFIENGPTPLVIVADSGDPIGTPNLRATIQHVLDSIQFEPGG
jgi:hypothetical protein